MQTNTASQVQVSTGKSRGVADARDRSSRVVAILAAVALVGMIRAATEAAPLAYIANSQDDTITVMDTATNSVVTTIPVGDGPCGVILHPNGSLVYVSNKSSKTVSVIDTATQTVIATVAVQNVGCKLAVHPDGHQVYVSTAHGVSVIDTATNTVIASVALKLDPPLFNPPIFEFDDLEDLTMHPAGTQLYVDGFFHLYVMDTATNALRKFEEVGFDPIDGFPGPLAVHPLGTLLYAHTERNSVPCRESFSIHVIDLTSKATVKTIPLPGKIVDRFAMHPMGTFLYGIVRPCGPDVPLVPDTRHPGPGIRLIPVSSPPPLPDALVVTDTVKNEVVTTLSVLVPPGLERIVVHPAGTRVYVVSTPGVWVMDTTKNAWIATVPAGINPSVVAAIDPTGAHVYVVDESSSHLSVIETSTNTVRTSIPIGKFPIAIGQFPHVPSSPPSPGLLSPLGGTAVPFGQTGDLPVPGDYDGDGRTDFAVWRPGDPAGPSAEQGIWFVLRSSDGGVVAQQWGSSQLGDIPVPGDYDGDGRTDFAVWRPGDPAGPSAEQGIWFVLRSSDGGVVAQQWGSSQLGDTPVPGDYDGDGRTDFAVWRASSAEWFILASSTGSGMHASLGAPGDIPVPGRYLTEGQTTIAVWGPHEPR